MDSGFKYRPEGWITSTTFNSSSSRPGLVTEPVVQVTEGWWDDYTVCGFNLGRVDGATMTVADHSHLRIYVPKATE